MIKAEIKTRDGAHQKFSIELPVNRYELYETLRENGINMPPDRLRLNPRCPDDPSVTLTGESDLDKHIIAMSGDHGTLADINRAVDIVGNASEHILPELYQRISGDNYGSFSEMESDIEDMLWNAGQDTISFYYPLVGQLDDMDDDGAFEMERIGASYLSYYEGEIREALIKEQRFDTRNIVSYMNCGEELRDKLVAMLWDVETIGDKLYGRTDVRIAEPLTPEEKEAVIRFTLGQNSDGMLEGFEQRPISIDEGDLYVSMWNSGDDYFICEKDELDEHIEQSGEQGFDPM